MLQTLSISAQRWALRRLERLGERAGRYAARPDHLLVGERGEREALFHLRSLGFTIVARRWRTGRLRGDIDLIAWEGDSLCCIEVKTRTERNVMDPAEAAVDPDKRRMLRRMASAYMRGFPEGERHAIALRFDVLAVYLSARSSSRSSKGDSSLASSSIRPEFELFRNAFGKEE